MRFRSIFWATAAAFFCFGPISRAQDKAYAYSWVQRLASDSLAGRGYCGKGAQKAVVLLQQEYEKLGLKTKLQAFTFPVNVFTAVPMLSVNGTPLRPGIDFLVDPASPSGSDKKLSFAEFKNNLAGFHTKLTWSVSVSQAEVPRFHILDSLKPSFETGKIAYKVKAKLETTTAHNLFAYLPGESDSIVVVSAHYDHLGGMGPGLWFPGANDNASGTAMLLDLARHFAQSGKKPAYTLVFVGFAGEEAGLIGSRYLASKPEGYIDLDKMKTLINLDLMGGGSKGLMVVNGWYYPSLMAKLTEIGQKNGISSVQKRDNAPNSDHYPFANRNLPAWFIYTLGDVTAYHDIQDRAETMPYAAYNEVFHFITDWMEAIPNLSLKKAKP